jgi:ABC-type transport system substrate-binding protein
MWSHAAFGEPDEFLFGFYHSTGSRNYGKWGSPALDAMIEKQRGDVSKEERKKILVDIQREMDDKAYRQGVAQPQPYYLVQPWLKGFVTLAAETGYQALQVENSWIDKG